MEKWAGATTPRKVEVPLNLRETGEGPGSTVWQDSCFVLLWTLQLPITVELGPVARSLLGTVAVPSAVK